MKVKSEGKGRALEYQSGVPMSCGAVYGSVPLCHAPHGFGSLRAGPADAPLCRSTCSRFLRASA